MRLPVRLDLLLDLLLRLRASDDPHAMQIVCAHGCGGAFLKRLDLAKAIDLLLNYRAKCCAKYCLNYRVNYRALIFLMSAALIDFSIHSEHAVVSPAVR